MSGGSLESDHEKRRTYPDIGARRARDAEHEECDSERDPSRAACAGFSAAFEEALASAGVVGQSVADGSTMIEPLCGSMRESCTRCDPHSGPRRAKRAKRYWALWGYQAAEPLAGYRGSGSASRRISSSSAGGKSSARSSGRGTHFISWPSRGRGVPRSVH